MIAEANRINFGEYLPSILGPRLMKLFDLFLTDGGFTKYNPDVDPSTIQSAIVGALRFGHSQVHTLFHVYVNAYQAYNFTLRNKFFEMSDIWMGNVSIAVILARVEVFS